MTQAANHTERPLRLLVLASAGVIHTRRWVEYFRARGHDVVVATLDPTRERELGERVLPTRFLRVDALRYPLAAPSVSHLVRRFRPDLINAHYVPGYGFMAALSRAARPLVVTCWGSDVLVNPRQSFLHRARARFVVNRTDLFTCDAAVLGEALSGFGVEPERILEVPMGVDTELFKANGGQAATAPMARRGGGSGRPFRILSTRRLEPLYCVETLLRAALILREAGWNFTLSVVGDGSERQHLEQFAGYYALEDRLTGFRGWLNPRELALELGGSDIYVSCSLSDGTSVSLLEAMACGVFPVVSDIPGNREWVRDGENGLLFPAGDHGRLSECLHRAITDDGLRERARALNLELVTSKAVWERNMQRVENRFRELAGAAQAAGSLRGRQNGQKPVVRS